MKRRLWDLLELTHDPEDRPVFDWFDVSLMTLIVLNVLAVVLHTVASLERAYAAYFWAFEVFSVAVFTVEYVLRLAVCTADPRYAQPVRGRLRLALSPMGLVDLLAILPFFLPMLLPVDLRFMRALRLFRLVRLFKLGRYSPAFTRIQRVVNAHRDELLASLLGVFILLVLASSLMYYAENTAQPEAFSSIPAAMWWGVSALTTIGYGDIYPITPLGKVLASFIAMLGIGLFALPAGILAQGFADDRHHARERGERCPYCGTRLEPSDSDEDPA